MGLSQNNKDSCSRISVLMGIILAICVVLMPLKNVRADSSQDDKGKSIGSFSDPNIQFLETVAISTGVGFVLGASTLPFYDQPGTQLINLAYGASIGAAIGVGFALFDLFEGHLEKDDRLIGLHVFRATVLKPSSTFLNRVETVSNQDRPVAMPLVSYNW